MWDSTVLNLWTIKGKKRVSVEVCGTMCMALLGRENPLPVSCDHHCCWVVAEGLAELDVLG